MSAPTSPLHGPSRHESAYGHVSGAARYVDDLPRPGGLLIGLPVGSPIARGRLKSIECAAALAVPGVHAVLLARDIPGHNRLGPIVHDEPLLAEDELYAVGQLVALIVGESVAVCRAAAQQLEISVDESPAILSIADGLGFSVTAEGVETREQASALAGMQCDLLQGYLIGRPVPAARLPAELARIAAEHSARSLKPDTFVETML